MDDTTWIIVFMHDTEPSVRLMRCTEQQAEEMLVQVRLMYDDDEARLVKYESGHDDYEALDAEYEEWWVEGARQYEEETRE
jgi:hypothetical protein